MFDFFQNIFSAVISAMASVIIAVGLVSVPEVPKQPLPIVKPEAEIVIEKTENQKTEREREKTYKALEVPKTTPIQESSEQDEKIDILREEIKNLESYLREHYDYVPHVRAEQNETLVDFLERQKKVYEETIGKARKIENEVEALNRSLVEGALIKKQIDCLEKLGIYTKVLEDIEKIKDSSGLEEPIDTRPYIEEQYLKVEKLCNE